MAFDRRIVGCTCIVLTCEDGALHASPLHVRRILVTGGAGFLGSHLCMRLAASGHHVICLDNFYTGDPDNVAPLLGGSHPSRFELVRHDVVDRYYAEVD